MINVAIDELPISKNIIKSNDYAGEIIFGRLGYKCISINNVEFSIFKYKIEENNLLLKITHELENKNEFYEELKKLINYISLTWVGVYRVFFLGIVPCADGKLYVHSKDEICIKHVDYSKIYLTICLLSSHYFNLGTKKSTISWNNSNTKCLIKSENIEVNFYKIPNATINILQFYFGKLDITANTVFPYYWIVLLKHSSKLFYGNSGIESILIANNKSSKLFENKWIRKKIFSYLGENIIPETLKYNIKESSMNVTYPIILDNGSGKLSIGYDDYYPNKLIAKQLKKKLENRNIKVTLKKQDYFNPQNNTDLKLYLFSHVFVDKIINYYFIGLITNLKSNREEFYKYLKIIANYFEGKIEIEECSNKLKKIILDNALYYSIGEIQSVYLSNNNIYKEIYIKN